MFSISSLVIRADHYTLQAYAVDTVLFHVIEFMESKDLCFKRS